MFSFIRMLFFSRSPGLREQNLRIVFWMLAATALAGGGWLGANKFLEREARKTYAAAAGKRLEPLVGMAAQLRKAMKEYEKKMRDSGASLAPGSIVTLEDLERSRILSKEELPGSPKIRGAAYVILAADAPDLTVQLELVTDQGRAVLNKKGEGQIYKE